MGSRKSQPSHAGPAPSNAQRPHLSWYSKLVTRFALAAAVLVAGSVLLVAALLLGACSGPSRSVRALGAESAKGWRLEASAVRLYRHIEGGLSPSRDEWWVSVEVRALKGETDARLGELWQALAMDEPEKTAGRWFQGMTLEHCGDGERVLFRLRPVVPLDPPIDPRWHLFVAAPSAIAVDPHAVVGDTCHDALAAAPSVDAWLVAALQRPVQAFPPVKLGGAVLGQPAFPSERFERAMTRVSPFVLAAREGRRSAEAIDFALDRLPAYDELVRWRQGRDSYGPFDVLSTERDRLREAVRRDAALRAHVFDRAPPAGPPEVVAWDQALRAAARPN